MPDPDLPQIYLVSPQRFDLSAFGARLSAVLDAAPIACLRLAMADGEAEEIARAADFLREIAHARDVPLVVTDHWKLAETLGLDGVHLTSGAAHMREARKVLGPDAIVGAACGSSRHAGMNAGEIGADYVAFGPVSSDPMLGDGSTAGLDLFAWWSEMIELPVVAEGGITLDLARDLAPVADFLALGPEIWNAEDAPETVRNYASAIGLGSDFS